MDSTNNLFREDVLRSYLGKYQERFKSIRNESEIILCTDPHPIIVAKLWLGAAQQVSLFEYVEVEKDDPYYGTFDYYQIDILTVPLADPNGIQKIESAIARTFLAGAQLIKWN